MPNALSFDRSEKNTVVFDLSLKLTYKHGLYYDFMLDTNMQLLIKTSYFYVVLLPPYRCRSVGMECRGA